MRILIGPLVAILIFNLIADTYLYFRIRKSLGKLSAYIHIGLAFVLYAIIIWFTLVSSVRESSDKGLRETMWVIFTWISIYLPKYIYIIFDLIGRIPKLWDKPSWRIVSWIGSALAIVVFLSMWWGALINRFRIHVNEITIEIAGLPESFDGYRIVQFSDLHTGTYGSDTTFVAKLVDRINSIDADAVMFTGDIVNRHTSEVAPFIKILGNIQATDGVYSILGNHDYGDYRDWDTPNAKIADRQAMVKAHRDMTWILLRDSTAYLHRQGDSIAVIGVENIGDHPFPVYGSLTRAYPDVSDSTAKILLSHNPAHWVDSIQNHDNINIGLTLSGHTHAMQIEIDGHSPASLEYETWGGKYTDSKDHTLYVNIGSGTVALPMRLGATPELTVITLKSI